MYLFTTDKMDSWYLTLFCIFFTKWNKKHWYIIISLFNDIGSIPLNKCVSEITSACPTRHPPRPPTPWPHLLWRFGEKPGRNLGGMERGKQREKYCYRSRSHSAHAKCYLALYWMQPFIFPPLTLPSLQIYTEILNFKKISSRLYKARLKKMEHSENILKLLQRITNK